MTFKTYRFITPVLTALTLLATTGASADTLLTFLRDDRTDDGKREQSTMQIYIAGQRVRFDMPADEEEGTGAQYMLYDASKPAYSIVSPQDKSYRHLEGASLKAMQSMGQRHGLQKQMLKATWAANDKTPSGIACRWAELSYGAIKLLSFCLADQDKLGLDKTETAALRAAMSFGKNTFGDLSQYGLEGFPVIMKDDEGANITLSAISYSDIPATAFAVPSEYERMEDDFDF